MWLINALIEYFLGGGRFREDKNFLAIFPNKLAERILVKLRRI